MPTTMTTPNPVARLDPAVPDLAQPLVTFAIYAANEERHIAAAIHSAFAQTYSPLEIVLSDDHSTDHTYEIMQRMAAEYEGPHQIILNRNEEKMGIGNQINRIVAVSRGELIVMANGDDISLPGRTERQVRTWLESGRQLDAIGADMTLIDADGREREGMWCSALPEGDLATKIFHRLGGVAAASLAVTRRLFERFGPLHPNLIIEDNPLALRAMLLGGYRHLPECLVQYRVHDGNCCRISEAAAGVAEFKRQVLWLHRESFRAYLQFLSDLYAAPATTRDPGELARARRAAAGRLLEHAILRDYYGEPREALAHYWKILLRLFKELLKATIKSRVPWIDRRNARWYIENRRRHGI